MAVKRPAKDLRPAHTNAPGRTFSQESLRSRLFAEEVDAVRGTIVDANYGINCYEVWVAGIQRITNGGVGTFTQLFADELTLGLGSGSEILLKGSQAKIESSGAELLLVDGAQSARLELFQLSFDGVPVVTYQQPAVADATGAGDVVAQLNALLAAVRAHGLIAT